MKNMVVSVLCLCTLCAVGSAGESTVDKRKLVSGGEDPDKILSAIGSLAKGKQIDTQYGPFLIVRLPRGSSYVSDEYYVYAHIPIYPFKSGKKAWELVMFVRTGRRGTTWAYEDGSIKISCSKVEQLHIFSLTSRFDSPGELKKDF